MKVWQDSECTAKLEHCVGGALRFYSPPGVEVPLILVCRWSPYPGIQTCGLGHLGPLQKVFQLYPINLSLDLALDVTVMADSDSKLSKVSKKSILLLIYTILRAQPHIPLECVRVLKFIVKFLNKCLNLYLNPFSGSSLSLE